MLSCGPPQPYPPGRGLLGLSPPQPAPRRPWGQGRLGDLHLQRQSPHAGHTPASEQAAGNTLIHTHVCGRAESAALPEALTGEAARLLISRRGCNPSAGLMVACWARCLMAPEHLLPPIPPHHYRQHRHRHCQSWPSSTAAAAPPPPPQSSIIDDSSKTAAATNTTAVAKVITPRASKSCIAYTHPPPHPVGPRQPAPAASATPRSQALPPGSCRPQLLRLQAAAHWPPPHPILGPLPPALMSPGPPFPAHLLPSPPPLPSAPQ